MAYQINKTDGTIVATVADGQTDSISTDLTLIGKNYSGYGESFNENFVKLLENFADTSSPEHPIKGQIWFDSSELKLKVYSGTAFLPVSSASIASTQPTTLGVGDLWFNDVDKQLYFFDGTSPILLAPLYTDSQLLSGLKVESILDTLNQTRVVTYLYTNGILLGIFSKDSFTPKNAIDGFSGSIVPGFNSGDLAGIKFDVTSTNSEQLGGIPASTYVRNDTDNEIQGQLSLRSNLGLVLGTGNQGSITVESGGNVVFRNSAADRQMIFEVRKDFTQEQAISISSSTRTINFYEAQEDSLSNFGGNVEIQGDITVRGTLTINDGDITTYRTTEIVTEDKIINLAETGDSSRNTDANASGSGVVIKGASEHLWLWSYLGETAGGDRPALAAEAWTSSENINIASGKSYKIDGVDIVDADSFYGTSIPNVTNFGAQNIINIGATPPTVDFKLEVDSISGMPRITTTLSNSDLEIAPNGSGNVVMVGSPKITGLADPTDAQDGATKEYVDSTIESRPIILSIDLSDSKPNSYIINEILNNMCPVSEFRSGTTARVLCNIISNSTTQLDINPLINTSLGTFSTPTGTADAVTAVAISQATVGAPSISTSRVIKEFQILGGVWSFVSDTILAP